MKRIDEERLQDMLEAARKTVAYADGKTRADLEANELVSLGLVRLIEIIGEAAKTSATPQSVPIQGSLASNFIHP